MRKEKYEGNDVTGVEDFTDPVDMFMYHCNLCSLAPVGGEGEIERETANTRISEEQKTPCSR